MAKGSLKETPKKKATPRKKIIKKPRIRFRSVKYDDVVYKLAIPQKGLNLSDDHKLNISKVICLMYETNDHSLEECCKGVGISVKTFFNWRSSISIISEAYNISDAKNLEIYFHRLKNRGRTNAERLLDGFTVELVDTEEVPETDAKGVTTMKVVKIKKKQMFIRPSVKLTETVLYNTDGRNFEKNPKPTDKMNQEVDIEPITWVDPD